MKKVRQFTLYAKSIDGCYDLLLAGFHSVQDEVQACEKLLAESQNERIKQLLRDRIRELKDILVKSKDAWSQVCAEMTKQMKGSK